MGAALALVVLLAGSILIVRIASVFLRLTGLPENVARFQAVSALTGAGFTTSESEEIVNYPARRRTIVLLMVLGNLGLVSVVSTFFVALAGESETAMGMVRQIALLLLAIGFIGLLLLSKTLDRVMCAAIEVVMRRFVRHQGPGFDTLLVLPGDIVVARHQNRGVTAVNVSNAIEEAPEINIICFGPEPFAGNAAGGGMPVLEPGQSMVCAGPRSDHDRLVAQFPRAQS